MGPAVFSRTFLSFLLLAVLGGTRAGGSRGSFTFGSEFFHLFEKFLDERILGGCGKVSLWGRGRVSRPGVGVAITRRRGDFRVHGGNVEGMVFVFVWWLGLVSKVGLGGII